MLIYRIRRLQYIVVELRQIYIFLKTCQNWKRQTHTAQDKSCIDNESPKGGGWGEGEGGMREI